MDTSLVIASCIFLAILLFLFVLFFKQLKGIFSLILSSVLGGAGLYIFNFLCSGFTIGINIASASVVGVLGIPGLLLLIVLKVIYK